MKVILISRNAFRSGGAPLLSRTPPFPPRNPIAGNWGFRGETAWAKKIQMN
jgi:hypothetical protein